MTNISQTTKSDELNTFTAYQSVVKTLQIYIDSAKTGDGKKIRTAFYDRAHIVGSIGGEFSNASLDTFEQNINAIGPSPDLEYRIVSIDITGTAASAKVEFNNWAGFRFTDFFVLYKHDEWKISGKVYDSHSQN